MLKHLETNENLEEIIKNGYYLVDFYAEWCGPCKMLAPVLEGITSINIIKVDVDKHPSFATKFGVMSVPTLIWFNNGIEVNKEIGYRSKEELEDLIKHFN